VVDNGSAGAEVRRIVRRIASTHERCRVVRSDRNLGFAAGANAGIEAARAGTPAGEPADRSWLLLLNDDAELVPGFADAARRAIVTNLDVGLFSALRLRHADPGRIDSAGLELVSGGGVRDWLADESVDRAPLAPVEILGPSGGAALYRADVLERLGGFEPSFFAFFEDVDLALRARAAGERALLIPDARVLHRGGATARTRRYRRLVWLERNRVRLGIRHFPALGLAGRSASRPPTPRLVGGGSGLPGALALLAHAEAWLRALLRAPSDLRWRSKRLQPIVVTEIARWRAAPAYTLDGRPVWTARE